MSTPGRFVPFRTKAKGWTAHYFIGPVARFLVAVHISANMITVAGFVGWSVGENLGSGTVRVQGNASECVGASARGGLIVIEGDASSRAGISLKGGNIVVGGKVGNFSAFMAQAGTLLVCGDAGEALGDSLYETVIYLRGRYRSLGADAQEEQMTPADHDTVAELLRLSGFEQTCKPGEFKRIASAKTLYHFDVDKEQSY